MQYILDQITDKIGEKLKRKVFQRGGANLLTCLLCPSATPRSNPKGNLAPLALSRKSERPFGRPPICLDVPVSLRPRATHPNLHHVRHCPPHTNMRPMPPCRAQGIRLSISPGQQQRHR